MAPLHDSTINVSILQGFDHVDDILKLIFQYLNMLREEGPQKWIFDEYCRLNEMQFRFKDKENPLPLVSNIVHSMTVYPLKEVMSANFLLSEWRPVCIIRSFICVCAKIIYFIFS
jgi:insulysin